MGVYVSRTWSRQQGLIIGAVVASLHLLFLLYLHYAYHSTYEGEPVTVIFMEEV